jgi:CelD/BcsL family acetyltransferase involved in cellulose biosynthesis/GNAT superfamily N-acetyltransferase
LTVQSAVRVHESPLALPVPRELSVSTVEGLAALERAILEHPLIQWEALVDRDPSATLFQSPVWAMPWYRCYGTFEPLVLVIARGDHLVGVVPLAIERATGRMTFAGDNMTDYRDVVTDPAERRSVVRELLRLLKSRKAGLLHFGSTYPESATPALLLELAPSCGVHTHVRHNYGWRWWPHEQKEDPLKKKSVRYPINYFKRTGSLLAEHVTTAERWAEFKERFYTQHTLRQLFGGRGVSLNDPQKQAFFDALFRSKYGHVTALWHNDELIAGHVGAVFRRVLYWGAPSFDVRHRQYSPNIVLLALTMAERASWGFDGIDLTIGKGEVKERFSTSRVDLPWLELHTRRDRFIVRQVRAASATAGKAIAARVSGNGDVWDARVKPVAERVGRRMTRLRELGPAQALTRAATVACGKIAGHRRGLVYCAVASDVLDVKPALRPGETLEIRDNAIEDLAKRDIWNDDAAREIAFKVRTFTDCVKNNRTFHTLTIDDRLAAWGYSYWPTGPATLTEIGDVRLDYEPNSVSLYDFYTLPEFRGRRLYSKLLAWILQKRFAEGAERAYISVLEKNRASRTAIERVGFKPVQLNEALWLFKWRRLRSRALR